MLKLFILASAAATASAAPAAATASAAPCVFQAHTDYDTGSGGTNVAASSADDCCAQCLAAGAKACWAAVFDVDTGGVCWFKSQAQTTKPSYNAANVQGCWPAGRTPPPQPTPPPPPPPPAPGMYNVTLVSLPPDPVISFLPPLANTDWPQSFNPAFVQPSAGTGGKRGLLVRSQNCSGVPPGHCIACNVDKDWPIAPYFPGSVLTFSQQNADGSFQRPYLVFAPDGPDEDYGTEDPRLAYDASTGLYHLMYTCYSNVTGGNLCHATTTDPTLPYPGKWTRLSKVFPDIGSGTKSGALLIRPQVRRGEADPATHSPCLPPQAPTSDPSQRSHPIFGTASLDSSPPHYLYWGDSNIRLAVSNDLVTFTNINMTFITPRSGDYDDALVEAGPLPMKLSDGNYIFFHNSNHIAPYGYHPEFVILNGTDPTQILQRANEFLLAPTRDWEVGAAPAACNVGNVVFLEAVAEVDGEVDTFDVWFGGSDTVVGTARFKVTRNF